MPKRRRAPEGPFAVFYHHLGSGSADTAGRSHGRLRDTLSVWPLLSDGSQEACQGKMLDQKNEDGEAEYAASVFMERCKQLLSEDHVQAALLAASALAKHSITLPPLKFDRSKWNPKIAASLPLRAIKPPSADDDDNKDDGDLLQSMYPNANTQRPGGKGLANVIPKAERLPFLLGSALDKFLSVAVMKEVEERAAAQQLLRLAAEEEARAGMLTLQHSDSTQQSVKGSTAGRDSMAGGLKSGQAEKASISAAVVAALATQKLLNGRSFGTDLRALSRRPSGELSGRAGHRSSKSQAGSPRASHAGGRRSTAGGWGALRGARASSTGGLALGGGNAASVSRPVSRAQNKRDMLNAAALDHLSLKLQASVTHRASVSFGTAGVAMLAGNAWKSATASARNGSYSARVSNSGVNTSGPQGSEDQPGVSGGQISPRGQLSPRGVHATGGPSEQQQAPSVPPRLRISLTGTDPTTGMPSPGPATGRVSRFAPTQSAGGALTASFALPGPEKQGSFKVRRPLDRHARMSLPGHQLEHRASFAPTLTEHRSIRVSHDGFEDLSNLPQGELLDSGSAYSAFGAYHMDDDDDEMPGKDLIWDVQKPADRAADFGRGYASHAGVLGSVAHHAPHIRAGPRASLTGAMLATNAALGTAPKIKASGAAAAALAVFNAAAGTPAAPSPSRFSMPAPLKVHLDSSSSDDDGDSSSGSESSSVSDSQGAAEAEHSPALKAAEYNKASPVPAAAIKAVSIKGDVASPKSVHMNHPTSRLASLRQTVSRPGSAVGHTSPSSQNGAPSPAPKAKAYDPWATATGAVQLDDEDEEARAQRVTRLMGRGGHLLKPRTKAPAFGAGRPSTAGGSSMRTSQQVPPTRVPSMFDTSKASQQGSTQVASTPAPVVLKEPSRSGVCLSFIQTLAGLVTSEVGPAAAYKLTTSEVVQRFVVPRTPFGSRFIDTIPEAVIGSPRYMISHRRSGSFLSLVQEVTRFLQDQAGHDPDRVFLWLDFMAIDQSTPQEPDVLLSVVNDVIRIAHQTLVVVDPEGTAFNRTWVLYEMWATTRAAMPNKLVVLAEGGLRATPLLSELYTSIDVMRSEACDEGEREALLLDMRSAIATSTTSTSAALTARTGGAAASAITAKARELASQNKGSTAQTPKAVGSRSVVRRDVSFTTDKQHAQEEPPAQQQQSAKKKRNQRRPTSMALLQADMTIINRAVKAAILDSCVREAKRAMKVLGTPKAVPTAYIRHATLAAVMYHLNGQAGDAEILLRRLMAYQLSGPHGNVKDLANVVLGFVDALMAQHKRQDALTVAGKAHDAAERLMGPYHKVTVQFALNLWEVLTASGQHVAAEALARSLHTRLMRLFDNRRPAEQALSETVAGVHSVAHSGPSSGLPSFHAVGSSHHGSTGNSMTRKILDALSDGGSSEHSGDGGVTLMSEEAAVKKVEMECELAATFLALGKSLIALNMKTEASSVLEEGLDHWQALLGGTHHPRCIDPLLTLGRCVASMQMHGDAIPSFTQARAMLVRWYARDSSTWVEACCDQAASLQAMGDLRTAEKLMRRLLAPPLRTRLSSKGGAADDKQQTPNKAKDGGAPFDAELAAEEAEDVRLGRLSFKVKSRLVEVLAAKSVTVPFQPTVVEFAPADDYMPAVHSPKVAGADGKGNAFLGDFALSSPDDTQLRVSVSPSTTKSKDASIKSMTEAERIIHEAVEITARLLARYARSRAAIQAARPPEPEAIDNLAVVGTIPLSNKLDMSKAKSRLPVLPSTAAVKAPAVKRDLPVLPVLGKADAKKQAVKNTTTVSPEVEQTLKEIEARRHDGWRNDLLGIVQHLREHAETLRDGEELEAAYSALNMALTTADDLLGPSSPTTVELIALTIDALMRLRRFKQAFNIMTTYRNHPSMSSGALELLRIQLEPLMTAHGFEAADTNDPELVVWALELGSSTMNGVERLLVVAAANGFLPVTMAITTVAASSVAEEEGEHGMRALAVAAALGYAKIVAHLLNQKHVMVDAMDWDGRTALWHAATCGQYDCTCLLLERGRANPNTADMHRMTPLMSAASEGHLAIMQILLEKKGRADAVDSTGRTALMMAAEHSQPAALELLLRCHAKANLKDQAGSTALMLACADGSYECVYVLLSNKCDVDAVDAAGQTAFFKAAAEGHARLVGMLLVEGADLYVRDLEGRTLLHAAAQAGQVGVVALVIKYLAKGIESIPGHNKRLGANDASTAWMSDAHNMGVQAHVKMKVDEVLTARGLVVANQVTGTIDESVEVIDDHMKTLLLTAAAKSTGVSTVTTAAPSMSGQALARKSAASQAADRTAGVSLSGQADGEQAAAEPEMSQEEKDLDELRKLLVYTHVAQVRQFVCINDKYGLAAADLARSSGHSVLGRLMMHFMKKAVKQMESDKAMGGELDDDISSTTGVTPSMTNSGLPELPSLIQRMGSQLDPRPRRESFSGDNVRRRLLSMAEEYDD